MIELSKNITSLRNFSNLTQEELGNKINTSKGTVSNYENGHSTPSIEKLIQLADVFNVTTDYLLGRNVDDTAKISQKTIENKDVDRKVELATKEVVEKFIAHYKLEIKDLIMKRIDGE